MRKPKARSYLVWEIWQRGGFCGAEEAKRVMSSEAQRQSAEADKRKKIRWRRSVDIEREAESQSLCVCVSVEWREFERTRRENSGRDNACLLYSSWGGTILLFVFLSLPLLLLQLFGCHHFLYYPSSLCFFLNLTPFAYLTNYLLILH